LLAILILEVEEDMAENLTLKELVASDLNQQPLCITFMSNPGSPT
jgi:hypothetical protein